MQSVDAVAEEILHIIKNANGIKFKDLCSQIYNFDRGIKISTIEDLVEELVKQHKIIEIEYTIDLLDVALFLLPAKTQINVRGILKEIKRIS